MQNIKPAENGRFTLRYLFALTASVAISLLPSVVWGSSGVVLSVFVLLTSLLVLHQRYKIAGFFTVIVLSSLLLLSQLGNARPSAERAACLNNVKQVTLAIVNYEAVHGHFPPPFTTDKHGNPLHSWRVLILPFLEQQELYDSIDLRKPWHDPVNLALADRMPRVYQCPTAKGKLTTTSYLAIVGDQTVWPRGRRRTTGEIADGLTNTLLVLEIEKHRVHWMSTSDLSYEMLLPQSLSPGPHNGASTCSYCDGHAHFFFAGTNLKEIQEAARIDDDAIDDE